MPADISNMSHEELSQLWPQAANQLKNFADSIENQEEPGQEVDQLRMAIQMADRYYEMIDGIATHLNQDRYTATSQGNTQGQAGFSAPAGFSDSMEYREVSIGQLKNAVALVQKFYQIFTAVISVVGPLLDNQGQGGQAGNPNVGVGANYTAAQNPNQSGQNPSQAVQSPQPGQQVQPGQNPVPAVSAVQPGQNPQQPQQPQPGQNTPQAVQNPQQQNPST